jgi:hypothetical protein
MATSLSTPLLQPSDPVSPRTQQRLAHVAERRDNLAKVLDVDDVRGVPLKSLLASCAALFAEGGQAAREDPAGTFGKSRSVKALDYFVSHSWRSVRWGKYAALLLHFNFSWALVALCCVGYVAYVVGMLYFDELPRFFVTQAGASGVDSRTIELSMFSVIVGALALFAVLLCGHHAGASRYLFLDIACIPQDDAERQAKAIQQLGAVLDRSKSMICLIDEHYWKRLWCVFEVASFYRRAGPSRLVLIPLHLSKLRLFFSLMIPTFSIFFGYVLQLTDSNLIQIIIYVVVYMPFNMVAVWVVVQGIQSQRALDDLRDFRLSEAECTDDDDREALLRLIGDWFADHNSGETDPDRLRQVGWHRFESIVRHELPLLVEKEFGSGVSATTWAIFPLIATWNIFWFYAASTSPDVNVLESLMLFAQYLGNLPLQILTGAGLQLGAQVAVRLGDDTTGVGWRALICGGAVSAIFVLLQAMCDELLTTPWVTLQPDFRLPDDGLDASTRKALKMCLCCVITVPPLLIIGSSMRR